MESQECKRLNEFDVARLQGAWEIVHSETSGKLNTKIVGLINIFEDCNCWWTFKDIESDIFQYAIDASQTPKQVDFISPEGVTTGIYKFLDGDMLFICSHDGSNRPTDFVTSSESHWGLSVCRKLPQIPIRKRKP